MEVRLGKRIWSMNRRAALRFVSAIPIFVQMGSLAEAKIAQAAVKYQTEPKDGKECDQCNFFIAPNGCKMVDGEINPHGYCALWVKKAS
jgi:hypothetical protein